MLLTKTDLQDLRNTLIVFIGLLTIILLLQWFYKYVKYLKTLPPGPWGIPMFGYLFFMCPEKHTGFMKLAKRYGTIFSARLGSQLTVVLSDYKIIREVFKREEFTGRPDTPLMQTLNGFGKC